MWRTGEHKMAPDRGHGHEGHTGLGSAGKWQMQKAKVYGIWARSQRCLGYQDVGSQRAHGGTLGMNGSVEDGRGLKGAGPKSLDLSEMLQLLGGDKMVPFALCSGTWGSEEGPRL